MLEKWALIALISLGATLAAYLKGREDGSQAYYALVANLSETTKRVEKATNKANTTRKGEKERETAVFAGLDLRIGNDLQKISPFLAYSIPDADRVRLTDTIVEAANSALRVPRDSKTATEKVPAP